MGVILLLMVAYAFLSNRNDKKEYGVSGASLNLNDANSGQTHYDGQGNTVVYASISKQKARQIAYALIGEFKNYFADENKILALLKGLNITDYHLVYQEFGTQTVSEVTNSILDTVFGTVEEDLTQMLTREIQNSSNKQKLKSWFPSVF